jgi:hypothetical protein
MSETKRQRKVGQDKEKRNQARRRANANPTGVRGNRSAHSRSQSVAADVEPGPTRRERRRVRGIAINARVRDRQSRASAGTEKRPRSEEGQAVPFVRTVRTPIVSLRVQEQRLTRPDWHQYLPDPAAPHGCHRRQ